MSNDKMREEFEAWSATHEYFGGCALQTLDDRYRDIDLQHTWESWKASREALVIDLPTEYDCCGGTTSYEIREMAIEAVKDAGLKVKP